MYDLKIMHKLFSKIIIFITLLFFASFNDALVNPVSADHCGNLTFCEQCVASHCGWGGPNGDVRCRDAGSNTYSCPSSNYSLWYTLPGQCGTSSGNWCSGNTNTPPPCNTFNFNCSSCLQQPACAYSGGQCVSVDPAVGNVCPAGKTDWYWESCSKNECSVSAPAPSPSTSAPSPLPSAAPGTRGYRADIQTCKADGSGWEIRPGDANVCTIACGVPPAAGQPAPPPPVQPIPIPPTAPVAPTTPGLTTPWIQTSGGDVHSNTKIDVPN